MSLTAGTRFGPYEIVAPLGAGGMGEVYRARDARLGRDVALKVIAAAAAADADHLARFEQEARATAALNHPNILAVFDIGHDPGPFIVSELLDGETLRERLARGRVPERAALAIGGQIARGLAAAHDKGIVHRDLKPENIFLTRDGAAKILDFGLAKLREGNPPLNARAEAVTASVHSPARTAQGVVMGTVGYMAPEQVRGESADHRADIFALGCVVYELLAGRRAFSGPSQVETLHAILTSDPPEIAGSGSAPVLPGAERIVRRCLEKDPVQRFQSARDLAFALEQTADNRSSTTSTSQSTSGALNWRWIAALVVVGVGATTLGTYLAGGWSSRQAPIVRYHETTLASGLRFTANARHLLALSPDGRSVVYSAGWRLNLRILGRLGDRPIEGTEGNLATSGRSPFFSPDGSRVGFWQLGKLKTVPVEGGRVTVLCDAENPWGASWTSANMIVYGQGPQGIWQVSADGGTPEQIIKVDSGKEVAHGPQVLPGGELLFTVLDTGDWNDAQIVVQRPGAAQRTVVHSGGTDARYLATGHVIFARANRLFAIRFDANTLTADGDPVELLGNVEQAPGRRGSAPGSGAAHYAVSDDGLLVYVANRLGDPNLAGSASRTLVWVDRQGRESQVPGAPVRQYLQVRLSPDGTRAAVQIAEGGQDPERAPAPVETDIWVWNFERPNLTRLSVEPGRDRFPTWMPDGRKISFSHLNPNGSSNHFSKLADGAGNAEPFLDEGPGQWTPYSWSADGAYVMLFNTFATDIGFANMRGDRSARPLLTSSFAERGPSLSPDGRWMTYFSDEPGQFQIFVAPFPDVHRARWQISTEGGTDAIWSPAGHEVFYRSESDGAVTAVPVSTTGSEVKVGAPIRLTRQRYVFGPLTYDVSPDGQRFLMIKDRAVEGVETGRESIILIENWFEELKQKMSTRQR